MTDSRTEIARLRAERDEARAACAGMRAIMKHILTLATECADPTQTLSDIVDAVGTVKAPTIGADVLAVVEAAREYRKAEQDGTPRMWRGKDLQDLANRLDDALANLDGTIERGRGDLANRI